MFYNSLPLSLVTACSCPRACLPQDLHPHDVQHLPLHRPRWRFSGPSCFVSISSWAAQNFRMKAFPVQKMDCNFASWIPSAVSLQTDAVSWNHFVMPEKVSIKILLYQSHLPLPICYCLCLHLAQWQNQLKRADLAILDFNRAVRNTHLRANLKHQIDICWKGKAEVPFSWESQGQDLEMALHHCHVGPPPFCTWQVFGLLAICLIWSLASIGLSELNAYDPGFGILPFIFTVCYWQKINENHSTKEFQRIKFHFSFRTYMMGASEWVVMGLYWGVLKGSLCLVFPNNQEGFHYYIWFSIATSLGKFFWQVHNLWDKLIKTNKLGPGMVAVMRWTRGHRELWCSHHAQGLSCWTGPLWHLSQSDQYSPFCIVLLIFLSSDKQQRKGGRAYSGRHSQRIHSITKGKVWGQEEAANTRKLHICS